MGFNEEIDGHFSGVGLGVSPAKRGLGVLQVFPGSPAAGAGIKPGEVVVSVNGQPIAGQRSEAAIAKIKGPEGSQVTIGVADPPRPGVRQVRLIRARVQVPVTTTRVKTVDGKKLGYVSLSAFTEVLAKPCAGRWKGSSARGRRGSCSTSETTAVAC